MKDYYNQDLFPEENPYGDNNQEQNLEPGINMNINEFNKSVREFGQSVDKHKKAADEMSNVAKIFSETFKEVETKRIRENMQLMPKVIAQFKSLAFGAAAANQGVEIGANDEAFENAIERLLQSEYRQILPAISEYLDKGVISRKTAEEVLKYVEATGGVLPPREKQVQQEIQQMGAFDKRLLLQQLSPTGMLTQGAMFALSFPMQMALFEPIMMPFQYTKMGFDLLGSQLKSLTGLDYAIQNMMQVLQVNPFQRYEQIFQSQLLLSSALGGRLNADRTLNIALEMAREYPLQAADILQSIRSLAVYPEIKPYIRDTNFQRDLIEVVSGLALINPMQGLQGALFSIVEAMSGSFRSLQMRFNVSPEIVAREAKMSLEEMKSSPYLLIQGLHRFVQSTVGLQAIREQKYTFTKQIENFDDALTFLIKRIYDVSGLYPTISKGATAFVSGFAEATNTPLFMKMLNEQFFKPYADEINKAFAEFLNLPLDVYKNMSPAEIEGYIEQEFRNLNPEQIRNRFRRLIKQLGEAFKNISHDVDAIMSDLFGATFGDIGAKIASMIGAEIKNTLKAIFTGIIGNLFTGNILDTLYTIGSVGAVPLLGMKLLKTYLERVEYPAVKRNVAEETIGKINKEIITKAQAEMEAKKIDRQASGMVYAAEKRPEIKDTEKIQKQAKDLEKITQPTTVATKYDSNIYGLAQQICSCINKALTSTTGATRYSRQQTSYSGQIVTGVIPGKYEKSLQTETTTQKLSTELNKNIQEAFNKINTKTELLIPATAYSLYKDKSFREAIQNEIKQLPNLTALQQNVAYAQVAAATGKFTKPEQFASYLIQREELIKRLKQEGKDIPAFLSGFIPKFEKEQVPYYLTNMPKFDINEIKKFAPEVEKSYGYVLKDFYNLRNIVSKMYSDILEAEYKGKPYSTSMLMTYEVLRQQLYDKALKEGLLNKIPMHLLNPLDKQTLDLLTLPAVKYSRPELEKALTEFKVTDTSKNVYTYKNLAVDIDKAVQTFNENLTKALAGEKLTREEYKRLEASRYLLSQYQRSTGEILQTIMPVNMPISRMLRQADIELSNMRDKFGKITDIDKLISTIESNKRAYDIAKAYNDEKTVQKALNDLNRNIQILNKVSQDKNPVIDIFGNKFGTQYQELPLDKLNVDLFRKQFDIIKQIDNMNLESRKQYVENLLRKSIIEKQQLAPEEIFAANRIIETTPQIKAELKDTDLNKNAERIARNTEAIKLNTEKMSNITFKEAYPAKLAALRNIEESRITPESIRQKAAELRKDLETRIKLEYGQAELGRIQGIANRIQNYIQYEKIPQQIISIPRNTELLPQTVIEASQKLMQDKTYQKVYSDFFKQRLTTKDFVEYSKNLPTIISQSQKNAGGFSGIIDKIGTAMFASQIISGAVNAFGLNEKLPDNINQNLEQYLFGTILAAQGLKFLYDKSPLKGRIQIPTRIPTSFGKGIGLLTIPATVFAVYEGLQERQKYIEQMQQFQNVDVGFDLLNKKLGLAALAGGALMIGGALLAPFTGGTSLALSAVGGTLLGYGAYTVAAPSEEQMKNLQERLGYVKLAQQTETTIQSSIQKYIKDSLQFTTQREEYIGKKALRDTLTSLGAQMLIYNYEAYGNENIALRNTLAALEPARNILSGNQFNKMIEDMRRNLYLYNEFQNTIKTGNVFAAFNAYQEAIAKSTPEIQDKITNQMLNALKNVDLNQQSAQLLANQARYFSLLATLEPNKNRQDTYAKIAQEIRNYLISGGYSPEQIATNTTFDIKGKLISPKEAKDTLESLTLAYNTAVKLYGENSPAAKTLNQVKQVYEEITKGKTVNIEYDFRFKSDAAKKIADSLIIQPQQLQQKIAGYQESLQLFTQLYQVGGLDNTTRKLLENELQKMQQDIIKAEQTLPELKGKQRIRQMIYLEQLRQQQEQLQALLNQEQGLAPIPPTVSAALTTLKESGAQQYLRLGTSLPGGILFQKQLAETITARMAETGATQFQIMETLQRAGIRQDVAMLTTGLSVKDYQSYLLKQAENRFINEYKVKNIPEIPIAEEKPNFSLHVTEAAQVLANNDKLQNITSLLELKLDNLIKTETAQEYVPEIPVDIQTKEDTKEEPIKVEDDKKIIQADLVLPQMLESGLYII